MSLRVTDLGVTPGRPAQAAGSLDQRHCSQLLTPVLVAAPLLRQVSARVDAA